MNNNPFIITLTGPSACGKTYITNKILELGEQLQKEGTNFQPLRFFKYTTRPYRVVEAIEKNKGVDIDVKSVKSIPCECELVYRTYGHEYGLKLDDLRSMLNDGISPIVVINDVRAVEELKSVFNNQVLSLFIFRDIIPDATTHEQASKERGGGESITRFEKAVALYRVFIENIYVFDRVILNVDYNSITQNGEIFKNITYIQTENIIYGVLNNKIPLNKKVKKSPKLFIVSGNAASGKDDIIKAALKMGRLQTDILIKHTSRWQDFDDENEIICKYQPNTHIISECQKEYESELSHKTEEFAKNNYLAKNKENYRKEYDKKDKKEYSFDEFCNAKLYIKILDNENSARTGIERFWDKVRFEQDRKMDTDSNVLSQENYLWIRDKFFELNPQCLDLEKIKKQCSIQIKEEIEKISDKTENHSFFVTHNGKKYILYENNNLYGKPIDYGFEIGEIRENWGKRNKHLVLTASLPNIFRICKEIFGKENVITAFTYSQISQAEHLNHSDRVTGQAKLKEYQDILRYANNIVDFDYALIYAETSLNNKTGNQKSELVDQMFRLFRIY